MADDGYLAGARLVARNAQIDLRGHADCSGEIDVALRLKGHQHLHQVSDHEERTESGSERDEHRGRALVFGPQRRHAGETKECDERDDGLEGELEQDARRFHLTEVHVRRNIRIEVRVPTANEQHEDLNYEETTANDGAVEIDVFHVTEWTE